VPGTGHTLCGSESETAKLLKISKLLKTQYAR